MDLRPVLHELNNMLQPLRYHVDRLRELKGDHPVFSQAMSVLPQRLAAIERLIERTRILARPLTLRSEPVQLAQLLDGVWRSLDEKRIHIERSGLEPSLSADGYWLHIAIQELLKNACEALEDQEAPAIALQITAEPEGYGVCIDDNGRGLPPGQVLFEPFVSRKNESGAGLGLLIARHVFLAHGGSLALRERSPAGVSASFWLPRSR